MYIPVEHIGKSRHKSEGDDDAMLKYRRAILARMIRLQREHYKQLDALRVEYRAVMWELRWPIGCVERPRRVPS